MQLEIVDRLFTVARPEWNAIATPPGPHHDPLLDWDFLEAREASRCATTDTGWSPRHLLIRDGAGKLIGAAPLYLKTHSRGEFVFDHGWADALHRAGGR